MSRRIRVLHVIQNLNYGGMERLFADIVRLLDPERFESHVMYVNYLGRFGEGLERYATIHQAVPLSRWSMLHPGPLIQQIRDIAPDVMHTHSGVWYKFTLAARHAGVRRLIHTEHGRKAPDPFLDRMMGRLASRRTDVIAAVSETLARHLKAHVVADPERVRLVANGVDTERYRPRPDTGMLRRELGLEPGVPILGSIGRLEPIKGYDVMIQAFAEYLKLERSQAPLLVIAGEGSERQRLENMVRELGLAARVRLLGWRDDVDNLHSAFTLFTMSSRSEGTSVSLLEAMSVGLVPAVTRVGGNPAVLGEELEGSLVASEDPRALAVVWHQLLSNRERLVRAGAAARARVEGHFSLQAMVDAYAGLYAGA
jgi:glycosyltransferase involved in cell wall biosynthesis